jgi:hypothetical protein
MGPPLLTVEQKQIRVQMAIELLQVLSVQSTRQWHDIVTLDESWIYLFSEQKQSTLRIQALRAINGH